MSRSNGPALPTHGQPFTAAAPTSLQEARNGLTTESGFSQTKNALPTTGVSEHSYEIVRNFQLAWFGVTMGWGGTAFVIDGVPDTRGNFKAALHWIGLVVWLWSSVYWVLFAALFLARCFKYPRGAMKMLDHPVQPLFFGAAVMGLTTVVLGFMTFGESLSMSRSAAVEVTYVFFWVLVVLAVFSTFFVPYLMAVRQQQTFESVNGLWLLCFIPNIHVAACGGTLCAELDDYRSSIVLFVSLAIWGWGLFLSSLVISALFIRILLRGVPGKGIVNAVWVVVGPFGQGANTILRLGKQGGVLGNTGYYCPSSAHVQAALQPAAGTAFALFSPFCSLSLMFPGFGIVAGVCLWAIGTWWLYASIVMSLHHARKWYLLLGRVNPVGTGVKNRQEDRNAADYVGLPFSLGWWGMIFPFCTHVFSVYELYTVTGFGFFKWIGWIYAAAAVLHSVYVHLKTIKHVIDGRIWETFKPVGPLEDEPPLNDGGAVRDSHQVRQEAVLLWKKSLFHPFSPAPKYSLSNVERRRM